MVEIREARGIAEHERAAAVFSQVWGGEPMTPAVLKAFETGGSYVAAAFDADHVVGAICGFVGIVGGEQHLHSHIAGVLPSHRRQRLGAAMKWHQRDWCLERGISVVTWTFDPLVRRNGMFNFHILGAQADAYEIDVYGAMNDEINRGDPSDRLHVHWQLDDHRVVRAAAGARQVADRGDRTVATPVDIEKLRRLHPSQARRWREDSRAEFLAAFEAGEQVVGMTADGSYVFATRS